MSGTTLSGTLSGTSRADILQRVKIAGAAYFGTPCVVVSLTAEKIEGEGFAADYTAKVWHNVSGRAYGPGKCQGCNLEDWPQAPLNRVLEWS